MKNNGRYAKNKKHIQFSIYNGTKLIVVWLKRKRFKNLCYDT